MGRVATFVVLLGAVFLPTSALAQGEGGSDIVGGQTTTIEEWPWQVAIADPPASGGNGQARQFCGGSLVSRTAVLTAAHCAFGERGFEPPTSFSVITGRTTLSDSSSGAEIPVTDVFYFVDVAGTPTVQSVTSTPALGPQKYEERAPFDWDVVILELASPAPAPAAPIALATTSEFDTVLDVNTPGDQVFATGYGTQFFGSPTGSNTLNEVELMTKSDADCGDGSSYGADFLDDVMVCAGRTVPPGDSCQGDSGGPLTFALPDGTYRLIGDTSFGVGCAVPEQWGVYGRVADSTMRPSIVAAITEASGGQPPPTGTAPTSPGSPTAPILPTVPNTPATQDRLAPDTTFSKQPRKRTSKRKAKFAWAAAEASTFSCSLDGRKAFSCQSPLKQRVKRGRHRFEVIATDAAGNVETEPAVAKWRVGKRRP